MSFSAYRSFRLAQALFVAVAAGAFLASDDAARASTGAVTVTSSAIGVTPQYIGYNMGHYLPGSNTSAWVDHSQVNAFRVWASASYYEPVDDRAPYGDNVNSLAQFDSRKADLRADLIADPASTSYINWDYFTSRFDNVQSGRNKVQLDYILPELHERGIEPIMNITRSENYDISGFGGQWEQWQHFYAMAFQLARDYDITRYQMYNEPDQSNSTISQEEWQLRMKLASDGVRSAIEDVNTIYGKNLVADMSAPTAKDGADTYDEWGRPAVLTNRTDFAGRTVDYDIFDTYDLHRYNNDGPLYAQDLQTLRTRIPQDNPSGQRMPVTYTEFNRRASSSYASSSDTPDTPTMFTELATIYQYTMSEDVKGLYAFKFSQTEWEVNGQTVPQETGLHYVDNTSPYDITGETRSGAVVRLAAKGFKGERPRLATNLSTSNSNYTVTSSFDPNSGNNYLLGVNRNSADNYDLTFDLSGWNVQPGSVVSIEEVSVKHNGEVVRLVTVPDDRIITLSQPAKSVWLLTAPEGAAQQQIDLTPTDDARVRNSDAASGTDYANTNYGSLSTARVGRSDDSARLDYATYLKFDLGDTNNSEVSRAILQLTGSSDALSGGGPADSILFHVYAITDDAWSEDSITWNNAPNLNGALDAKLSGVGTTAFPVGQLTFDQTMSEWGIDITQYVQNHGDSLLSFALVREKRFADDIDPSLSYVDLFTKESNFAPRLSLFSAVPELLLGDYNGDNVVDAADYTVWRDTLGAAVEIGFGADGNKNGLIDQADYSVWKSHFGDSISPGASAQVNSLVPEPATLGLVSLFAAALLVRRRR